MHVSSVLTDWRLKFYSHSQETHCSNKRILINHLRSLSADWTHGLDIFIIHSFISFSLSGIIICPTSFALDSLTDSCVEKTEEAFLPHSVCPWPPVCALMSSAAIAHYPGYEVIFFIPCAQRKNSSCSLELHMFFIISSSADRFWKVHSRNDYFPYWLINIPTSIFRNHFKRLKKTVTNSDHSNITESKLTSLNMLFWSTNIFISGFFHDKEKHQILWE